MTDTERSVEPIESRFAQAQVLIECLLAHIIRGRDLHRRSTLRDCYDLDIFDDPGEEPLIFEVEVLDWVNAGD